MISAFNRFLKTEIMLLLLPVRSIDRRVSQWESRNTRDCGEQLDRCGNLIATITFFYITVNYNNNIYTYVRYDTVIIYIILRTKSILQNLSYVQSYTYIHSSLLQKENAAARVVSKFCLFVFRIYYLPILCRYLVSKTSADDTRQ